MSKFARNIPRSIAKTATYSVMHLTVAVTVAYALTGNLAIALGIGLIEPAVQTIAYTVHERAWDRFGKTRSKPGGRLPPLLPAGEPSP